MTLQQFQDWALSQGQVGKATDGGYVGQCVSLINQYLAKVHGINAGAWGDAKAWANDTNPIRQWFTPVTQSQPGDIGVYTGGQYGHIFIYTASGILEQNGRTPLRVTASPDRNATVILRPKAGMPQAPQGGNMATKVDTPLLRIIHTEMEGWPLAETHAGKFDAAFNASWGGANLSDVIWEKWNKNGPFREQRERNRIFFENNSALLDELKKNPTKAQYDEVITKMKEEQAKAQKAADEAEATRLALAAEQANKSQDTKLIEEGKPLFAWLTKLINRLKG